MSLQHEIVERFGVKATIEPAEEIRKRVRFLQEQVVRAKMKGLLIAVSGGIDSAVTAALCQKAMVELSASTAKTYETWAVLQPYHQQEDIADSRALIKALGIEKAMETNIGDIVDDGALEVEYGMRDLNIHRHLSIVAKGNMKARMRMVLQYAIAFDEQLLVVGTDHASEALTGFYTKYGDGAVDITPLVTLNKRQVRQLAELLGVPQQIIEKVPTAGLWTGQTDEGELGISYEHNSDYLEGKLVPEEVRKKIEAQYLKTEHKRSPIPGV